MGKKPKKTDKSSRTRRQYVTFGGKTHKSCRSLNETSHSSSLKCIQRIELHPSGERARETGEGFKKRGKKRNGRKTQRRRRCAERWSLLRLARPVIWKSKVCVCARVRFVEPSTAQNVKTDGVWDARHPSQSYCTVGLPWQQVKPD